MILENVNVRNAKIGDVCFGFRLQKKEYIKSAEATFYIFKHEKCGAELLYSDRADENKTFSVTFKTLPENSTGVFHILEHSVLNGSDKYPVKEPFVNMLQSSLQTFLNAMTFADKTMYPVSSRNDKDFFNLVSVYLDAVFAPCIYKKPEIFMQEGWHYEFESADCEPTYNGVVYSEMKGAFADVDTIIGENTESLLFPDNCYGYCSGGAPEYITDLTYESFIETHKRFYHPSNAKFILDGELDIDTILSYIDSEYLSRYDFRENSFEFCAQLPKPMQKTAEFEPREGEENYAHLSVSKILCRFDEIEKIYAAKILADYLAGSNESPLKRLILEKGLAQDAELSVVDGIYQPYVSFVARNTSKESFEEIKNILPSFARQLLGCGLNKKSIRASIERFAFSTREKEGNYGLVLSIKALDSWLYGGDPSAYIDTSGIFDSLRKKVDGGYFEELLTQLFCDPDDKSYLFVIPSLNKGEDDARREKEKILEASKNWTVEQRQKMSEDFKRFVKWQKTADGEEELSSLPHLKLSDIPFELRKVEKSLLNIGGVNALKVSVKTSGVVYLNMYFDLSDFTLDQLRAAIVLSGVMGELSTENFSVEELQTEIKLKLGSFCAKVELFSEPEDTENCTPRFMISASFLEENSKDALSLLQELILNGKYSEISRINDILVQSDYMLKQSIVSDGHSYAMLKALSAFTREGALREFTEGESFIKWFSEYTEGFTERSEAETENLSALSKKIFGKNRLFVCYGGKIEESQLQALIDSLLEVDIGASYPNVSCDEKNTTIEIPSTVGYSAIGHNLYAMGFKYSGSWTVLSSLITYGYLWNAVRVQGGAYGTGMKVRANGNVFAYSYRDPNLSGSKKAFGKMPEFLKNYLEDGSPLDDIIIGSVNATDPLLSPSSVCSLEGKRYLCKTAHEDIVRIRKEILTTTREELLSLIPILEKFIKNGKYCAVGDKESLKFVSREE